MEPSPGAAALPGNSTGARLPGLDLLRAIAIGWVLLFHASVAGLVSPASWIVGFGWMGVDLFFALSGFLIAGQLFRPWARGVAPDYLRFFARRLLRTLPAYLAVVALYFLVPVVRERPDIQPLWQYLTFTQNFDLSFPLPKAFSHAWSLCVEEQFYLVLPAVVALLARRPSLAGVVGVMVAVLLAGMALRGYFWLHGVAREPSISATRLNWHGYMTLIYYPTWSRLDGLLAGVAAAATQIFRPRWWRILTAMPNLLLATGIAGVGVAIGFFHDIYAAFLPTVFGFPLLAASMAMLVIAGSERRSIIGRYPAPGAAALAAGAYSLYLCNKMTFHAVQVLLPYGPSQLQPFSLVAGLLATLAGGTMLYWLVERPFLKLRDRLRAPSSNPYAAQPFAPASESASASAARASVY
jgi:peptidoglycan/LPS O-acetylase OafA/YrhL